MFLPFCASSQVLMNQATGMTTGGMASHDFETIYNQYDCEAADDFTVPSGSKWTIDSILIYGQYSASAQTTCPVRLTLYLDSGGMPGAVYETFEWTTDQDGNGDGDLLLVFDCPLELGPQRYWMGIQSTKTFGSGGGQYYWTRDTIGSGLEFHWRNPGGGFGTSCTTWNEISTCVSTITDPGTAFIIYGCAGGPSIAAFPSDTTVCSADSLVLTADNGGINNATFAWSSGDSTQALGITESGFYNVSVTDPNTGCYGVACIDVTVNETPMASLEDDTICQGNVSNFNGFANCGTCTYTWNDSVNGAFYSTGDPGWHYLEIVNPATGCSSYDSVWLEVESTDPPELAPGNEVDLCEGDSVYLSSVNTYASYDWSTGETTQGIFAYEGGDYVITVTTNIGCEAFDTIVVSERPAPVPSIILDYTNNWKTRLTASAGYQTYVWSNGETDAITIADSDGDFTVTVTDEFGCEGTATISVTIIPAGIDNESASALSVFPNPVQEMLTIVRSSTAQPAKYSLLDLSGRALIPTRQMQGLVTELSLSELPSGTYILQVEEGVRISRIRVVKL